MELVAVVQNFLQDKVNYIKQTFKRRKLYGWYCAGFVAMWMFLVCSIVCELISGNSITAILRSCFSVKAAIPLIFKIEAIRKTAETVGFGSILIAWIYAVLDREELGFKYGDLLLAMYPAYHLFVLGHLLSMLICVWLTETGMLEGAIISLSIVVLGCIIHWKALSNLVFLSTKRKNVAMNEWESTVTRDWEFVSQYQSIIYNIIDAFCIDDRGCYEKMQQYLTLALLKFANDFKMEETEHNGQILSDISHMWDRLMRGRPNSERFLILDSIFHTCKQYQQYQTSIGPICAGYILWLRKDCADNATGKTNQDSLLLSMSHTIAVLKMRLWGPDCTMVIRSLDSVFITLAWMHFVCGESQLSDEISFSSFKEETYDKKLLYATVTCIFSSEQCKDYFDIAFRQTFNAEEDRCETACHTS